jgi:hypothetical protein
VECFVKAGDIVAAGSRQQFSHLCLVHDGSRQRGKQRAAK